MFTVVMPSDAAARANAVTVLLEGHDGTLWAGTRQGLFRLELPPAAARYGPSTSERRTNTRDSVRLPICSKMRRARCGLRLRAGCIAAGATAAPHAYTTRDGLPHDNLSDLFQDGGGRLWAATPLGGFFRFTTRRERDAPVVDRQFGYRDGDEYGLPSPWVFQLFEASDGRFWVATARGVAEFLQNGDAPQRFRSYTTRNGLSYFDITAVNEDLGGNLWLGTNSAGVMKLTRGGFSTYGEQDGIETVHDVFEDRAGNLAFRGNVLGDVRTSVFEGARLDVLRGDRPSFHPRLGQLKNQRFTWFKPPTVTNLGWVMEHVTLQARDGTWWIGTAEGLYRFPASEDITALATAQPRAVYTTKDGLAALQVFRLFEDSRGNIWIATVNAAANGLARWDPRSGKICDLTHSAGLPEFRDDRPRSFGEEPSGTLWFGFNNGLARYAHDTFTFFTPDEGLPPGAIMDIHVDRSGRLWLASARGGLVRVDHTGATRPAFVSYTTREGLSSDNAVAVTEDLSGRIYVGGGHGIDRFDPATGPRETFHDDGRLRAGHGHGGLPRSDRCAVVRDVERPRPARARTGRPLASDASDPDHRVARHWRAAARFRPGGTRALARRLGAAAEPAYRSISLASASGPVNSCDISTCWKGPRRSGARQTSIGPLRTPAWHRVGTDSPSGP